MALFRDLNSSDQHAVAQEVVRQENMVSSLLLDVTRRSVAFLFLLLIASGIALLVAGTAYAYHASLFLVALICFLLGLLCIGILYAINYQTLFRLSLSFAWFKFRVLDSQIDTAVLNSPPASLPKSQRVTIASGYAAFALWVLGATLSVLAFTVGISAKTAYQKRHITEVAQDARLREYPSTQMLKEQQALTLADEIGIGVLAAAFVQAGALIWTILLARKTAQRQLRAYVGLDTADLLSGAVLDPPQPQFADDPSVTLMYKNTGQTPAYKVRTQSQIAVIERRNESSLIIAAVQNAQYSTLGSNVTSSNTRRLSRSLTPEEIAGIRAGTMGIYLYGRIEYLDTFKKARFTTFRLRYSGIWPLVGVATMNFADEGNEAN